MKAYLPPHLLYDLPDGLYYLCCVVAGRSMECNVITQRKGFYGLAFFLSLFGAVAVQKNIRDAGINPPKETQVTREEYSEYSRKPGQSNVTGLLLNSLICFCRSVVPA